MASVRKREWEYKGIKKSAWVVAYTDGGGKPRLKTFKTKKEAEAYRSHVDMEVRRGEHVADSQSITVNEALDIYIKHLGDRVRARDNMRRTTVYSYVVQINKHLRPQLGELKLTQLTAPRFQAWLNDVANTRDRPHTDKPYSKGMMEKMAIFMRLTIAHAQSLGYVGKNVLSEANLRIPGTEYVTKAIPTKADVGAMLKAARGYMKPLIHVAIFSGMRKGEIRALRWDNVDLEKGIIKVVEAASRFDEIDLPKTKASIRDIPMPPQLIAILSAWKMICQPSKTGLVFPSQQGVLIHNATFYSAWKQLQKDADVAPYENPKYHFHALRHVAASLLIESGLPPKRIQKVMGHTSIKMTFDLYGHLFEDDEVVRNAMDKIATFFVEEDAPKTEHDKSVTFTCN